MSGFDRSKWVIRPHPPEVVARNERLRAVGIPVPDIAPPGHPLWDEPRHPPVYCRPWWLALLVRCGARVIAWLDDVTTPKSYKDEVAQYRREHDEWQREYYKWVAENVEGQMSEEIYDHNGRPIPRGMYHAAFGKGADARRLGVSRDDAPYHHPHFGRKNPWIAAWQQGWDSYDTVLKQQVDHGSTGHEPLEEQ